MALVAPLLLRMSLHLPLVAPVHLLHSRPVVPVLLSVKPLHLQRLLDFRPVVPVLLSVVLLHLQRLLHLRPVVPVLQPVALLSLPPATPFLRVLPCRTFAE